MPKIKLPFYDSFSCLAKNCSMNCCRRFRIIFFQWEEDQLPVKPCWQDADGCGRPLSSYLCDGNQGKEICMRKDGSCPFWTGDKLCGLQSRQGAEALPSVCRTFPRLITAVGDRIEYGLDPCCPAVLYAARDWEPTDFLCDGRVPADGAWMRRAQAMECLANGALPLRDRLQTVADIFSTGLTMPELQLSGTQEAFTAKAFAVLLWSYLFSYDGHPRTPNVATRLLEAVLQFTRRIGNGSEEDWTKLSDIFADELTAYVRSVVFDDEIEGRYIDSKDAD